MNEVIGCEHFEHIAARSSVYPNLVSRFVYESLTDMEGQYNQNDVSVSKFLREQDWPGLDLTPTTIVRSLNNIQDAGIANLYEVRNDNSKVMSIDQLRLALFSLYTLLVESEGIGEIDAYDMRMRIALNMDHDDPAQEYLAPVVELERRKHRAKEEGFYEDGLVQGISVFDKYSVPFSSSMDAFKEARGIFDSTELESHLKTKKRVLGDERKRLINTTFEDLGDVLEENRGDMIFQAAGKDVHPRLVARIHALHKAVMLGPEQVEVEDFDISAVHTWAELSQIYNEVRTLIEMKWGSLGGGARTFFDVTEGLIEQVQEAEKKKYGVVLDE